MFQSLFLNKVAGCRPPTLLKRDLGTFFFCECCKMFKNILSTEQPQETASDS